MKIRVNGFEMYYEDVGKGVPVVFIHGLGGRIKSRLVFLHTGSVKGDTVYHSRLEGARKVGEARSALHVEYVCRRRRSTA